MVPVLQGQRTGQRGPEWDPPRPMQVVEIVKIAVVEIAVVWAVVGEQGQAGQEIGRASCRERVCAIV